ncbi:thiamine pyrophosphate-requiring protein [Thermithiobacillus plumbiphilus]|uniref:Thiamine pyrophosphate-requiring protein n=1 Tax=Thermithiobacillus plumbiphilus TaxID=1729899 RepID=A0ABU9D7R3_9PROT
MTQRVADFLVERLQAWGVKRVFGNPGYGLFGVLDALRLQQDQIQFMQLPHGEMAGFMASAHAKFSGGLGVCVGDTGAGGVQLLNGLYDAKKDHQPVLAILGQVGIGAVGADFQQEVDFRDLFGDVAAYVEMIANPLQARHVLDRAIRIALGERTVACVIIPTDIQQQPMTKLKHAHERVPSAVGYHAPRVVPEMAELQWAAAVLNAGQRVAILIGAGALKATDEVIAVAERLGAGVAKTMLAKAALPDDLPFVTGQIGYVGTQPSWDLMADCDTLLMIGSDFPFSEFLPKPGSARGVQIDLSPRQLGLRYPMEVNLLGDSRETLQALLPLLEHKAGRAWRERLERKISDWWAIVEARAMNDADPVNPQRVIWELSRQLPDDSILCADSGSAVLWLARDIRIRAGMCTAISGGLTAMGTALPYALAGKLVHPDRPVIALVGDGAMQMSGNTALLSIARHWREWADPRLIVLVFNNQDLSFITWEQRALAGTPKFEASQNLADFPYARYAELIGLQGICVDHPDQLAAAWSTALQANRPVLLEARTDPNVPLLPGHYAVTQGKATMKALLKGEPEAWGMIRQGAKDLLQDFLPHPKRRD